MARLVDLLGGQEVLLLLARGGVDVRREVVGDRVLAVEEQRVEPQRGPALELGERVLHCSRSVAEVDRGGAPSWPAPSACRGRRRRPGRRRLSVVAMRKGYPSSFGDRHGSRSRRSISSPSPSIAPGPGRGCRGRAASPSRPPSDWWSMVTAHGRADLVLTPVPAADRAALVVFGLNQLAELAVDLLGELGLAVLAHQREDRDLHRRELGVEPQHRPLLALDHVLVVGVDQEGEHRPVDSGRGLDHVGHVALARGRVDVLELLPRVLGVLGEVEIASVGDLLPSSDQPIGNRYSTSLVPLE